MRRPVGPTACLQRGAEAVEFALVATVFFVLLTGVIQMGWMLAEWNTATEATRMGARVAAVCDMNADAIRAKMRTLFPTLKSDGDIRIDYTPAGCDAGSCEQVTVSIAPSASVTSFMIPFIPVGGPMPPTTLFTVALPDFATTLPRESMQSTFDGVANPVCQ